MLRMSMAGILGRSTADRAEDFMYCLLCTQPVKGPNLLTECMNPHMYCRACWSQYIENEIRVASYSPGTDNDAGEMEIHCPTCNVPNSVSRVREAYPKEHCARTFLSYIKLCPCGEEMRKPCEGGCGSANKAKKLCRNCSRQLCADCSKKHRDQQHVVKALPDNYQLKCIKHKELITGACVSCKNTLVCERCSSESHSPAGGHTVVSLEEHMAGCRAKLLSHQEQLQADIGRKQQMDSQLTDIWWQHQQNKVRVEQDIDRHANMLIQRIEEQRARLKANLAQKHEQVKQALDDQRAYVQYHMRAVHNLSNLIGRLSQHGQEFLLLANYMQIRVRSHFISEANIGNISTNALKQVCTKQQFQRVDNLTVGSLKAQDMPLTPKVQQTPPNPMPLDIPKNPRKVLSINAPGQLASPSPKPRGLTYLPDDRLAVANNEAEEIQIYDSSGQLVSIIKDKTGKFFPNDLAYCGNGRIIVSDGKSKQLKMFKITDEPTSRQTPTIVAPKQPIFHEPVGIDIEDDKIIVADLMNNAIVILNMEGKKIRSFGKHGDKKYDLNCPEFLAVDNQHRIWVSDRKNNCVKVFTQEGKCLKIIDSCGTGEKLNQPGGIAIDCYGNVLVADGGNNRVCVFSNSGDFLQVLLNARDHDVFWPYGITVNGDGLVALTRQSEAQVDVFKAYADT